VGRGAADLILRGGRVWDQADLPGVDAVAIAGDRIAAVGSTTELTALADADTRVIDVGGRRVIPGLIDSHIHMVRAGLRWGSDVRWEGVGSLEAALERLHLAASAREAGAWIVVLGGWHPGQFEGKRGPTRQELDDAAPGHPVYVQRGYVEAFLNSRALAAMDLPATHEGHLDSLSDLQACNARLPQPGFAAQVAGTRAMLRDLNSFGLTGAIDAGGFGVTPETYRASFEVWRHGERGFRTRLLVGPARPGSESEEFADWTRFVQPGFGDAYLRHLGAGEVLLYGAHDMEGVDGRDIRGQADGLSELSASLATAGWPIHMHAILDSSVGTVLDAWERVDAERPIRDLRFTITHGEQVGERNLRRIRDLGIGVTVQHRIDFRARDSWQVWGDAQMSHSPPLRAMLDLGLPLGAGTDATVASSYRPWQCLWWLVTGGSVAGIPPRREEDRLSRDEALRLYTSGSAWFSFEEEERGNLRPGSHADLAVLSDDFLAVAVERIPDIESELTVVGGRVVHAGRALAAVPESGTG
jgi:predicted amidohydrolase YtcJ